jgi:hypothetical protein
VIRKQSSVPDIMNLEDIRNRPRIVQKGPLKASINLAKENPQFGSKKSAGPILDAGMLTGSVCCDEQKPLSRS